MKTYTKEEILKAAELGEVSTLAAKHIVSNLEDARHIIKHGFDCYTCKNSFSNPFDQIFCYKKFDLEKDEDCNGIYYNKR